MSAQNLEEISLKKKPKITGSFSANAVGYHVAGIAARRDPFSWFLNGTLNFNLFGYAAPFSFSYSNTNKSYSQPFNQFRFAPQYKWIKVYTGNTSMTFSPYTLAGHMFLGGGVDLTPGNWRISAMAGRLKKAVPFDLTDTLQHTQASFKRMGYGLKVGYEANGQSIMFNIFTAKDDPRSIPYVLPDNKITPEQNVAVGLSFKKTIFSKIFVSAEYAISALNTNTLANTSGEESSQTDTVAVKPTHNLIRGLLPENSTSRYFDAINAAMGYQGKQYNVQLKYERVAPEYQTLGAYYFNNDLRNITVATNVRLFNNKVTLGTNIGLQQNNLDKTRASTTSRTVGAATLQLTPNEKWTISAAYSNFSSYTNMRSQADPYYRNNLDTLNFYQVSETMNGSIGRKLGNQDHPQNIMLTMSYQRSSNKAQTETGTQLSDFKNATVSYNYMFKPQELTLALAVNAYNNNAAGTSTTFFGPTLTAAKQLFEKAMRLGLASSYNHTSGNTAPTSPIWNNQLNLNYTPAPKENAFGRNTFSLAINVLRRLQSVGEQPSFTETTATFNYSYSF